MGLSENIQDLPAGEIISWAISTYGQKFGIATGFQKEGMVIVDLAAKAGGCRVFTLDTGRLPEETYRMMDTVRERYGITVETISPEARALDALISVHGPNLFLQSPDLRAECCDVRKVQPLRRKLLEFDAWAAGLRRDQAATRASIRKAEVVDGRVRICPLADWTAAQVEDYTTANRVPVHSLYELGYRTIGCAPCTRAVSPGEDERAGRWWWEDQTTKECGIHFAPDGSASRVRTEGGSERA